MSVTDSLITQSALCPTCLSQEPPVKLNLSLNLEDQRYYCPADHVFDELPEEQEQPASASEEPQVLDMTREPSAADLDAVAAEQETREQTAPVLTEVPIVDGDPAASESIQVPVAGVPVVTAGVGLGQTDGAVTVPLAETLIALAPEVVADLPQPETASVLETDTEKELREAMEGVHTASGQCDLLKPLAEFANQGVTTAPTPLQPVLIPNAPAPGCYRIEPNGDALVTVTVRIPEINFQAFKAEAEVQQIPVAEQVRKKVDDALAFGWLI